MDLTKLIIELREKKRIKQVEIAQKLDMDKANYHRIENKGNKLTFEQLEAIANALGVSTKELLFGEKSENSNGKIEELTKEIELLKREKSILERELAEYKIEATVYKYFLFDLENQSEEEIKSFFEQSRHILSNKKALIGLASIVLKGEMEKEKEISLVEVLEQIKSLK
jgi:transcriptional regulator with XRE-family HTH domain